jgi:amino acid adenylation domain-containing protein/thioester reductase-like protein
MHDGVARHSNETDDVRGWSATTGPQVSPAFAASPSSEDGLVHRLYEEQARRTPQALAAVYQGSGITFAELELRAARVAAWLHDEGVRPDTAVGICFERSVDMFVAILGILKAGAGYVPLDPGHPLERLAYMLEDAAPRVVLTQAHLLQKISGLHSKVIAIDAERDAAGQRADAREGSLAVDSHARNLAYVIYTSGSTGRPKGVMIQHAHVLNLWQGLERLYKKCGGCTRVALNASLTFDASVQQIVQLLSGRTLFPVPEEARRDVSALFDFIDAHRIEAIDCTPSQLKLWLGAGLLRRERCPLRMVIVGGEAIDVELWRTLAQCTTVQFFNVYGPTECTVDATVAHLNGDTTAPHIGRPMLNRRVYVLDPRRQPLPVGVAGEIYIGGAGIARGYLRRAELTAECFATDPFDARPEARMYKTGDIGRWRADGMLEYLGRRDTQVKIRGFRIELGEIEQQLTAHPQVERAVVAAREDEPGNKRLVAYVVPAAHDQPTIEELRAHLQRLMPEYMVPAAFVMLEQLPLTASGKLDRRALPAPGANAYVARQYVPPQGEVEEILAGIWEKLLAVERIGRHDNFFELGGHSLLIVQMMERLRRIGMSAGLRTVYESPTLAALAAALTGAVAARSDVPPNLIPAGCTAITPQMLTLIDLKPEHIERIASTVPGGAGNIQDIYPLAPLQEGILFHYVRDEHGGDPYARPLVLSIASQARLDDLVGALQAVIDRHDVLRTAVLWEQLPRPVQVVYRHATLPVQTMDIDYDRELDLTIQDWLGPGHQRLDLARAPLMRLTIARDWRYERLYVLLQLHHIAWDYTSQEIVTSEIVAFMKDRTQTLPPSVPYRDHVAQALAATRADDAQGFFRSKLADVEEPTTPFGLTDVIGDGREQVEVTAELDSALAQRLRAQSRKCAVSAATLLHAAWALVVAKVSGRDDVVFGTVLLGRLNGNAGSQRILGMFINTLPLRLRLADLDARSLVEQTQRELVELLAHEQASLAEAQRCSAVPPSMPLFTALLNYRHSAGRVGAAWHEADGIRLLSSRESTNYPVTLSVDDRGTGFLLTAQVDRRIDPARLIAYMQTAVQSLVEALESSISLPAATLAVLPPSEREQVIESFNATQSTYPREKLIHQIFEERARRTPDAIALVHEGQALTYLELNAKANRLASYLRRAGVRESGYVPVLMSRSAQMVIAELAVLKSGAAYVPVDPELPAERRGFMIRDCAARTVLVEGAACIDAAIAGVQWIDCTAAAAAIDGEPDASIALQISSAAPAYVMYTSGSTGTPKGVIVPHYAVNRLAINNGYARIEATDCIPHYSNPAFDASTFEIWAALLNGARVLVVPQRVVLDGPAFASLLLREQVTILWITVGLFNGYTEMLAEVFAGLRYLITGGDSLDRGAIRRVLQRSPPRCLMNAYGPTECTTFSTTYPIESADEGVHGIPIGRPMANTRIYILDRHGEPVPIGVVGELYIGGDGVACGYLNRPDLTQQRFVPDPFSQDSQARMYRTGDLGLWRSDGAIEFLGRNDQQVKIRGFRIEPGEIEAHLTRHPQVREASVVVVRADGAEKRLVAYVTLRERAGVSPEALRSHLKEALPEFMIPSAFVALDQLPLSPSGKVDRRALPAPDSAAYVSHDYEAPQGELEKVIAQIWQDVLGVERIGRRDNFFELGGHSLLALQALSRMNQALHAALTVGHLYRDSTVAALAETVQAGASKEEELVDLAREATLGEDIVALSGSVQAPARTVLLTGATGFVGRFLLAQLLQDTDAKVCCLVRAQSEHQAAMRLRMALARWDLWRDELEQRISAIPGDLRLPRLGIDSAVLDDLCSSVDAIYHCGTSMNHLETYAMAKEANVQSARVLLQLATQGKVKVVNYISTLGVFSPAGSNGLARVVDELSSIESERHPITSGYTASKWVGEKIFMTAQARGIPCNIFRLGLVAADTERGRYDELQREYRILKTCLLSGFGIKGYRPALPPTPVDYVARAVVFLAAQHARGGGVFHLSSPAQLVEGAFECCNELAGTALELLPHHEWIGRIKGLYEQGVQLPAVPLIEWAFSLDRHAFEEHERANRGPRFDCHRTQRELERAGIVAPIWNDDLLLLCVDDMLRRDVDLRAAMDVAQEASFIQAQEEFGEARR